MSNEQTSHHGLTIWTTAVFIIGEIAGGGVLALPKAVEDTGWIGIPLLVVFTLTSSYTGTIIAKSWVIIQDRFPEYRDHVPDPYPVIGEKAYGKNGRHLVTFSINFTLFGASTVYLILASENIEDLMSDVTKDISFCYWLLILGGILTPITCLGTPKDFCFLLAAFTWKRCIARSAIVMVVLFVAESVPHFGAILSLIGGSTTTLLSYILPCVFYLKLAKGSDNQTQTRHKTYGISYQNIESTDDSDHAKVKGTERSETTPLMKDLNTTKHDIKDVNGAPSHSYEEHDREQTQEIVVPLWERVLNYEIILVGTLAGIAATVAAIKTLQYHSQRFIASLQSSSIALETFRTSLYFCHHRVIVAVRCEFGTLPISIKCYQLMCKYYVRLSDIGERSGGPHEILKAAFEVDKTLTNRENSWSNKLSELSKYIGISLNKHCNINFKQKLEDFYKNKIIFELSKIKDGNCGKLLYFSKMYTKFKQQNI
ncbi:SLC32A [Mytilus coruscus]|uniref:SLC32A n=1 Tax=Mytilus coruscus TaxID=42192 RepID=A0A6J8CQC3_MYTCO|nr:SLC32A [Mytilus coruscus]